MLDIRINRDAKVITCPFKQVFQGFENCQAVRDTFGEETDKVLEGLGVELYSRKGYMGVSEITGNLIVSAYYLKTGDETSIYLDVIHELVHVRQFREGKDLFDPNYQYVDRPTEVEAYAHSVKEAKRLGMSDEYIMDYLRMDWVTEEEVQRLAKSIGVVPNTNPKKNLVKPTARRPSR